MGATPPKAVINRFPQSGETEQPGGEGVETPPRNDSSIASLSPPVGGRFQKRLANKQMFRQRIKHYHQ